MKIVIVGVDRMFEVRFINDRGLTDEEVPGDLQQARRAAAAWSAAYRDCPVIDQTEGRT